MSNEAAAAAEQRARDTEASGSSMQASDSGSSLFPPNAKAGECWARTFIAPTYRTVTEQVLKSGESERLELIPAEYQTIKKRVMVEPPKESRVAIPAEYKTVKVRKMLTPEQERKITIPAEYQTITRTEKVSDGSMEWRRILCETNVNASIIRQVQMGLRDAGHNPGPIDGVIGYQTQAALKSYQRANNLAEGGLTYETLRHMNISL